VANLVPEAETDYYSAVTDLNSLSSSNRRKAKMPTIFLLTFHNKIAGCTP
jgi:hypothetical protein